MKRILFIAAHAYPIRSSESICNSKVAYSLAKAGYKVDVFTYLASATYQSDNEIDFKLRNSENLKIYEIENKNSRYFLSRSKSIFENLKTMIPLLKMSFKIGHFYNGMSGAYDIFEAIKKHEESFDGDFPYDIVITRAYQAELAAIYLKEKYNIKWIANWNDPYPLCRFPEPYGKGPNAKINFGYRKVYDKVKKLVDLHTFPSDRLKNYMINSFKTVNPVATMTIPHMAHSELLPNIEKKDNKCLKLVSCGDVSHPRNPLLFITALKEVIDEMNLSHEEIKCYFVGKYDSNLAKMVKDKNLDAFVELTGPMQYTDCLDFIASCDLSVIIEAQCEEGIYLPTKFADAVQCRVPVFCVSPQIGTLHDLVDQYHNGYFSDNASVESIKQAFKQAINDYRNNKLPIISKSNMEYFFEEDIITKFNSIFTN